MAAIPKCYNQFLFIKTIILKQNLEITVPGPNERIRWTDSPMEYLNHGNIFLNYFN